MSGRDDLWTRDEADKHCSKISGQFHSMKGSAVEAVRSPLVVADII